MLEIFEKQIHITFCACHKKGKPVCEDSHCDNGKRGATKDRFVSIDGARYGGWEEKNEKLVKIRRVKNENKKKWKP